MRAIAAGLMLVTAVAVAQAPSAKETASFVAAAKARLADTFVDPGSTQYRNLHVARHESGLTLCGEVNTKNRAGGYNGFNRFISSLGPMVYMGGQIDVLWADYCGDVVTTKVK